jgi:hypothetical protein
MTNELVTSTFYKQVSDKDPDKVHTFNYPNMQVVLLTVSCMYFFLGCTLEYSKKNWFFMSTLSFLMGSLKVAVRYLF